MKMARYNTIQLKPKIKQIIEKLLAAVREAQSLESINREREKRGFPIIYNPTVYTEALKFISKQQEEFFKRRSGGMADTSDLKSDALNECEGSSPSSGISCPIYCECGHKYSNHYDGYVCMETDCECGKNDL